MDQFSRFIWVTFNRSLFNDSSGSHNVIMSPSTKDMARNENLYIFEKD